MVRAIVRGTFWGVAAFVLILTPYTVGGIVTNLMGLD